MTSRRKFVVEIPQSELDDLRQRILQARWPEAECVDDWSQGISLDLVKQVAAYWAHEYDWRRFELKINQHAQFIETVDGLDIHYLHVRSKEPNAKPLLMTHGWPGSVVEFLEVIDPLVDPTAHGGNADDAFHLVIPSLPGYGFSGKPETIGWTVERTAKAWDSLMLSLGYSSYLAQGGDWGGMITALIGSQNLGHCKGLHLNLVVVGPPDKSILSSLTDQEKKSLALYTHYQKTGQGYAAIQGTRPQTIGYGLTDSAVGQLAWVLEKFGEWSSQDFLELYGLDRLLDNISWYWFSRTAASSARLYWQSFAKPKIDDVLLPTACSIFPSEPIQPSRRWAQQRFKNIQYWNTVAKGGHFAAMEQPDLFVKELREGLRAIDT